LSLRRSIIFLGFLGVLFFGWLLWRNSVSSQQPKVTAAPTIVKQRATVSTRTFDPDNLPADMPPSIPGELAVTDSNFISDARVGGDALQVGASGAMVTITQITVTLQLNITIWVPINASQHVIEHEEGHRQISEFFYQTADKLAAQIASSYMGKTIRVTGSDTHAEITKLLQKLGAEITDEYNKELNPDPTQLRYDEITDHSRNEVDSKDAVAQALKEAAPASTRPT